MNVFSDVTPDVTPRELWLKKRISLNRFDKMKIEISSISSETIFESLETISGPISWFECSIRVLGTQLARFHSYFQNPSRKFMTSSRLCPLKYPLDHMVV